MKVSQLQEMVADMVAEELKIQIPNILSEMFVKRVIQEQVARSTRVQPVQRQTAQTAAPRQQERRPVPSSSQLREQMFDASAGSEMYSQDEESEDDDGMQEQYEAPAARRFQIPEGFSPALALLAEDTAERMAHENLQPGGHELPALDFSKMKNMIKGMESMRKLPGDKG